MFVLWECMAHANYFPLLNDAFVTNLKFYLLAHFCACMSDPKLHINTLSPLPYTDTLSPNPLTLNPELLVSVESFIGFCIGFVYGLVFGI